MHSAYPLLGHGFYSNQFAASCIIPSDRQIKDQRAAVVYRLGSHKESWRELEVSYDLVTRRERIQQNYTEYFPLLGLTVWLNCSQVAKKQARQKDFKLPCCHVSLDCSRNRHTIDVSSLFCSRIGKFNRLQIGCDIILSFCAKKAIHSSSVMFVNETRYFNV